MVKPYRQAPAVSAHWTAHFVHAHMTAERMTQSEFLRLSGFPRTTLQRWWTGKVSPRVIEMEAMLEVFGYGLKPTPLRRQDENTSNTGFTKATRGRRESSHG